MSCHRAPICVLPWVLALLGVAAGCDSGVEDNVFVELPRTVTYHQDVAPLLAGACGDCHGIGPTLAAFDTYEQAVHWSPAIFQALLENTSPSCDPAAQLTDEEIEVFVAWVEDGTPRGPVPVPSGSTPG